jgi:hypothetical protein
MGKGIRKSTLLLERTAFLVSFFPFWFRRCSGAGRAVAIRARCVRSLSGVRSIYLQPRALTRLLSQASKRQG